MCGSTGAQNTIQGEQMQEYQQLQNMTNEQYSNFQSLLSPVTEQLQQIFQQGPSQTGMSAAEKNDLDATAIDTTAQGYAKAATAQNEKFASEGGGSLPSGVEAELQNQTALEAAGTESKELTQVDEEDYQQGLQNWQNAGQGLEQIASLENPVNYINAETGAGSAASNTANEIAQEQNSWVNAAIGGAAGVAGSVISENPGDIFG
jgi:hypothetical protein